MLKKIIIIDNEKNIQFDTEEDVTKYLIDEKFYLMTEKEKKEAIKKKAILNSFDKTRDFIEDIKLKEKLDFKKSFILIDERTYLLSLLIANKIVLLERKDSDIYTKNIDKSKFSKNYIIVNNFAEEILKKHIISLLN